MMTPLYKYGFFGDEMSLILAFVLGTGFGFFLERAGFGGTPGEIQALAAMTPVQAVRHMVRFEHADNSHLPAFEPSDIHDPGLEPFPASRPAVTELAKRTGEALGVRVKPAGNRRLQPVVNRFFYWLRASSLETGRIACWWASRMVATRAPLQEKMALFWHGHFAVSEDKVRDCRKLLKALQLFQRMGTGNFRDLMVAVAQDPAMLLSALACKQWHQGEHAGIARAAKRQGREAVLPPTQAAQHVPGIRLHGLE